MSADMYATDYEVGQDNLKRWVMDVHHPVCRVSPGVILEGLVAGVLLFGGGAEALTALQAAAITVGLPFTVVLIAMCLCLYLGLRHEQLNESRASG